MNNSDLKVTITGGNANIGNINQGDHGYLEATQSAFFRDTDLALFEKSLSDVATHNNIDVAEYQALKFQVAGLIKDPKQSGFVANVEKLYEKYNWALAPLSALFTTLIKNN